MSQPANLTLRVKLISGQDLSSGLRLRSTSAFAVGSKESRDPVELNYHEFMEEKTLEELIQILAEPHRSSGRNKN